MYLVIICCLHICNLVVWSIIHIYRVFSFPCNKPIFFYKFFIRHTSYRYVNIFNEHISWFHLSWSCMLSHICDGHACGFRQTSSLRPTTYYSFLTDPMAWHSVLPRVHAYYHCVLGTVVQLFQYTVCDDAVHLTLHLLCVWLHYDGGNNANNCSELWKWLES